MVESIKEVLFGCCTHSNQINDGLDLICEDCGLVVNQFLYNSDGDIFPRLYNRYEEIWIKSKIPKGNSTFDRLRKRAEIATFKSINQKRLRILKVLMDDIGKYLNLSKYIIDNAAYLYRKLDSNLIKNHITAICFCLWESIRFFKDSRHLEEVLEAFREFGHRVNPRLLIRDGGVFYKNLCQEGIKKSSPKSPLDYLSRIISKFRQNESLISKRLEIKNANSTVQDYLGGLNNLCLKVLSKLSQSTSSYYLSHPFNYCAAVIYFTDQLLSLKFKHKRILTHKIISQITGVRIHSIRDIYKNNLEIFYQKEKERVINNED